MRSGNGGEDLTGEVTSTMEHEGLVLGMGPGGRIKGAGCQIASVGVGYAVGGNQREIGPKEGWVGGEVGVVGMGEGE